MNKRSRYPCGLVRREALWQMGGGFAGLALARCWSRMASFAS